MGAGKRSRLRLRSPLGMSAQFDDDEESESHWGWRPLEDLEGTALEWSTIEEEAGIAKLQPAARLEIRGSSPVTHYGGAEGTSCNGQMKG